MNKNFHVVDSSNELWIMVWAIEKSMNFYAHTVCSIIRVTSDINERCQKQ
jgi:hypothetical protein